MASVLSPPDNDGTDNERVSEGWTVAEMRRYEAILTRIGYGALALAAGFAGASIIDMSQIADRHPVLGLQSAIRTHIRPHCRAEFSGARSSRPGLTEKYSLLTC